MALQWRPRRQNKSAESQQKKNRRGWLCNGRRTRRGWLCNGGRVGGKKKRAEDCSAMEGAAPKVERSAKERGARRKPVLSPPVGPPESAGWVLIGPQQRP